MIENRPIADEATFWTIIGLEDDDFQLSIRLNDAQDCFLEFGGGSEINMRSQSILLRDGQRLSSSKLGAINNEAFSSIPTVQTTQARVNSVPVPTATSFTTLRTKSYTSDSTSTSASSLPSTSHHFPTSTPPPTSTPATPRSSTHLSQLSPTAALGLGIGIGIITIILLLSIAFFLHRRYKRHHSPHRLHYRQAKQWKGFTPATPSTARTTFVEAKMANIYFAELPTPATPAFILTPPLEGGFGAEGTGLGLGADRWERVSCFGGEGWDEPLRSPLVELPT